MTKNDATIDQKIAQLEQAVAWFDSDEFELEQATAHYERAQKLADEIQSDIVALKHTIEQVSDSDA